MKLNLILLDSDQLEKIETPEGPLEEQSWNIALSFGQHLMVVGIPAHPISYAGAVGVRLFQNKTADQSACVFCCRRPS